MSWQKKHSEMGAQLQNLRTTALFLQPPAPPREPKTAARIRLVTIASALYTPSWRTNADSAFQSAANLVMLYPHQTTLSQSSLDYDMPKLRLTLLLSIGLFLAGCAQYHDSRGVDVGWQQDINSQFTAGKSTRKDVLDKLGPPSQVIALGDETILYYLYERSKGNGLVLVIYNRMEINTRYDRAIFFFDENDVLTEFSARNGGEHGE